MSDHPLQKLIDEQQDCPPEFAKVLDDNFSELVSSSGYAADPSQTVEYKLAMRVLQSPLYSGDADVRDWVDAIIEMRTSLIKC